MPCWKLIQEFTDLYHSRVPEPVPGHAMLKEEKYARVIYF